MKKLRHWFSSSLVDLWQWGKWGDPLKYQRQLNQLMEFTDDFLTKHGLGNEYWIDYGVLLGSIRHSRLIIWDFDLDIGITTKGYEMLMQLYLAKEPLGEGYDWYHNEEGGYLQFYLGGLDTGVWIDIVNYSYNDQNGMLHPVLDPYYSDASNPEEYCPPIPKDSIFPIERKGLLSDKYYPIPSDPNSYLTIVYGKYWSIRWIPLLYSFLYHPIQTLKFFSHYRKRKP